MEEVASLVTNNVDVNSLTLRNVSLGDDGAKHLSDVLETNSNVKVCEPHMQRVIVYLRYFYPSETVMKMWSIWTRRNWSGYCNIVQPTRVDKIVRTVLFTLVEQTVVVTACLNKRQQHEWNILVACCQNSTVHTLFIHQALKSLPKQQ